jgi:hypothetical protein
MANPIELSLSLIVSPGFRIQDTRYRIQDPGYKIQDTIKC